MPRSISIWWKRTVELDHVQADEICVKVRDGYVWQAMTLTVHSRLWLSGVGRYTRDGAPIQWQLGRVRACGVTRAFLLCVDGFAAYAGRPCCLSGASLHEGGAGRGWSSPPGFLLAQVIKSHKGRRLESVVRRVIVGTPAAITATIAATWSDTVINPAFIERLNATFRAHLVPLVRRSRGVAHGTALVESGMWLVGDAYNFC